MPHAVRATAPVPVGATTSPDLGQLELLPLLLQAADDLHMQEKELAFLLGYDAPYLSKLKAGEKKLPLERLERLPTPLRRAFWSRCAKQDGLAVSEPSREAQVMGRLMSAIGEVMEVYGGAPPRPRMARMGGTRHE